MTGAVGSEMAWGASAGSSRLAQGPRVLRLAETVEYLHTGLAIFFGPAGHQQHLGARSDAVASSGASSTYFSQSAKASSYRRRVR